jgi:hypothetical protein
MQYLDPKEGWDWFVRKTGRRALIWPALALDRGEDMIKLRYPRVQTIGGGGGLALFGVILLAVGYHESGGSPSGVGEWILLGFGVLLLLLGLVAFAYRAHVSWDPYGRTLTLCRGWAPFARVLDLPRDRLAVDLSLGHGEDAMSNLREGHTVLSLSSGDRPSKVHLASVPDREDLEEPCRLLSEFLGSGVEDGTQVAAALPDGTEADVDAGPLSSEDVGTRGYRLRFPSPDVATFRSRLGISIVLFVLPGLAMALGAWLLLGVRDFTVLLPFLAMVAIVALSGFAIQLVMRSPVVIDRQNGTISMPRGFLSGRQEREIAVADVAAVQVCGAYDPAGEGQHTRYEMNLVLREPPGERVGLVRETDRSAVTSDAQSLAEFLGVPLWDHS